MCQCGWGTTGPPGPGPGMNLCSSMSMHQVRGGLFWSVPKCYDSCWAHPGAWDQDSGTNLASVVPTVPARLPCPVTSMGPCQLGQSPRQGGGKGEKLIVDGNGSEESCMVGFGTVRVIFEIQTDLL